MDNEIQLYVNSQKPEESIIFCEGILLYLLMIIVDTIVFLTGVIKLFSV